MHRDEKPFECSECGKHFRQEIKLRYHYRLHFGDLPYGCNLCGKRFNTQRQLDTHTRVHTNERPYICEVCGLGFRLVTEKSNLKRKIIDWVLLQIKWSSRTAQTNAQRGASFCVFVVWEKIPHKACNNNA